MIRKSILKEIDCTIKTIWKSEIRRDYINDDLWYEDGLKCSLYFHLRSKLKKVLKENNLKLYTEYAFPNLGYRADMVIVEINPKDENSITNVIAVFELKFTSRTSTRTEEWVRRDIRKFKHYLQEGGLCNTQFYFAVIYAVECLYLHWMDKRATNNWANGRMTELNAGYIDGKLVFEVNSYNGLNTELNG